MSDSGKLTAWLFGECDRAEWSEETAWLEQSATVRRFRAPSDVLQALDVEGPPELFVAAQSRPGEFAPADVEAIRRRAPLTSLVQLAGAWCEGELRSGRPWRAAERVYVHQALPRWRSEFAWRAQGTLPAWGLPLTMTEDERLLARTAAPLNSVPHTAIAIQASSFAQQQFLEDASRACGYRTSTSASESVAVGVWDGHAMDELSVRQLGEFVARLAPAPVVALLSFPRAEDRQAAFRTGAAAVLSKPLYLTELAAELTRVAPGGPAP